METPAAKRFALWARNRLEEACGGPSDASEATASAAFITLAMGRYMQVNGYGPLPKSLCPAPGGPLPQKVLKQVQERLGAELPAAAFDAAGDHGPLGVGWLYQHYNQPRRAQVVNIYKGVVRGADIPAATGIYTPAWLADYLVQNTLGRLWLQHNPNSALGQNWPYLIGPVIPVPGTLAPSQLRILDPCVGAGHLLAAAFDLLMEIYVECGWPKARAARSILQHNLYGLDIDPKAVCIARFVLLMKARAVDQHILKKPPAGNLHTLAPPPKGFAERLPALGVGLPKATRAAAVEQAEKLAHHMQAAGLAGSAAQLPALNWQLLEQLTHPPRPTAPQGRQEGQAAEDDAAQTARQLGALVGAARVLAGSYPVVVTNPPYLNKMEQPLKQYLTEHYGPHARDLFSVFIHRCLGFCSPGGRVGLITPMVWMFLKTYQPLRRTILAQKSVQSLVQLAYSAFRQATVPLCAFVLQNTPPADPGVYVRLADFKGGMEVQRQKLLAAAQNPACPWRYTAPAKSFLRIPSAPLAYWAGPQLLNSFGGPVVGDIAAPKQGLATGNNARFVRYWFEVDPARCAFNMPGRAAADQSGLRWFAYNKGGSFRRWYGNSLHVVNWQNDGAEIRAQTLPSGRPAARPQNRDAYFLPCITWSKISSGALAFRHKPAGHIFDVAGTSLFADEEQLAYLHGLFNSSVGGALAHILSPTLNFEVGHIAAFPLVWSERHKPEIVRLVGQAVALAKQDWDEGEQSWDFTCHPLLTCGGAGSLARACEEYAARTQARFHRMAELQHRLNTLFAEIYAAKQEVDCSVSEADITLTRVVQQKPKGHGKGRFVCDMADIAHSLVSYGVGCILGRYSLPPAALSQGGAGGFKPQPHGLLGLTPQKDGLCEATHRFSAFLQAAFGEAQLRQNLAFLAAALGDGEEDGATEPLKTIDAYLRHRFYAHHCRAWHRHPIYWQYTSGRAGAFGALCYLHRYTAKTPALLQKLYLGPAARQLQKRLAAPGLPAAQQTKLQRQAQELHAYQKTVAALAAAAPCPNLDDGVQVNHKALQTAGGKHLAIFSPIAK